MLDLNSPEPAQVPASWTALAENVPTGRLLLIGPPDSGKTTLARYLLARASPNANTAYLDADPGQSTIGPPTTISLTIHHDQNGPDAAAVAWHWAVGAASPSGHMLPYLSGLGRLAERGDSEGASTIVIDTCGLVEPRQGGHVLKQAEIDLLQPAAVLALEREDELAAILEPLRRSGQCDLIELDVPAAARQRSQSERRRSRAQRYSAHFEGARSYQLDLDEWAIFPPAPLDRGRLAALCRRDGFCLALAVVQENLDAGRVSLASPLPNLDSVDSIRLADIILDLTTWHDKPDRLAPPAQLAGRQ